MRKNLSIVMLIAACFACDLSAATAKQKAAFRAERKATAVAKAAAKKAAAANVKASRLEGRAALLASKLSPALLSGGAGQIAFLGASDIPTPEEIVAEDSLQDAEDAAEYASWLTLTPEELAAAKAAHDAAEAEAEAAEKALLASMTPAERAAYKAAEAAADAIEAAADLARDAAEKAAYANMTFAERVAYNDEQELEEQELEDEWASLTPEQLAAAIAAHQAQEAADHAAEYAAWAAMTPEERAAALAAEDDLEDDVDSPDEVEIEDTEDFE